MIFVAYLKTCSTLVIAFFLFGRLERTTVATAWMGSANVYIFCKHSFSRCDIST